MTVAFMFLTYAEPHQVWKSWFPDDATVLIHSKVEMRDPYFAKYRIDAIVPTQWATWSIVQAELELMRAALRDGSVTHLVLLSDSCIPLLNYTDTVGRVSSYTLSALEVVMKAPSLTASQWIMLTRKDADIALAYPKVPRHMRVPDERFFPAVFRECNVETGERGLTYVNWDNRYVHRNGLKSPRPAIRLSERLRTQALDRGYLFYRKVGADTILECTMSPPDFDALIGHWSGIAAGGELPRDVALGATVKEMCNVLETRDVAKVLRKIAESIERLGPLCSVPCLHNGNTQSLAAWCALNAHVYCGVKDATPGIPQLLPHHCKIAKPG